MVADAREANQGSLAGASRDSVSVIGEVETGASIRVGRGSRGNMRQVVPRSEGGEWASLSQRAAVDGDGEERKDQASKEARGGNDDSSSGGGGGGGDAAVVAPAVAEKTRAGQSRRTEKRSRSARPKSSSRTPRGPGTNGDSLPPSPVSDASPSASDHGRERGEAVGRVTGGRAARRSITVAAGGEGDHETAPNDGGDATKSKLRKFSSAAAGMVWPSSTDGSRERLQHATPSSSDGCSAKQDHNGSTHNSSVERKVLRPPRLDL